MGGASCPQRRAALRSSSVIGRQPRHVTQNAASNLVRPRDPFVCLAWRNNGMGGPRGVGCRPSANAHAATSLGRHARGIILRPRPALPSAVEKGHACDGGALGPGQWGLAATARSKKDAGVSCTAVVSGTRGRGRAAAGLAIGRGAPKSSKPGAWRTCNVCVSVSQSPIGCRVGSGSGSGGEGTAHRG